EAGGAGRVVRAHAPRATEDRALRHAPHRRGRDAGRPGARVLARSAPRARGRPGPGAPAALDRVPARSPVRGDGGPHPGPAVRAGRGRDRGDHRAGAVMAWLGRGVLRVLTPLGSILALWYLAILFSGLPAFVIPRPER